MEVKANELRLGNYVLFNDAIDDICEIGQANNGFCEINGYFNFDKGTIKPIPLTEEILLKCGFERNEILNKNGFIQVKLNGSFYIGGDDACTCGHMYCGENLKYLHQLQNLYFALTNEELTVNL